MRHLYNKTRVDEHLPETKRFAHTSNRLLQNSGRTNVFIGYREDGNTPICTCLIMHDEWCTFVLFHDE